MSQTTKLLKIKFTFFLSLRSLDIIKSKHATPEQNKSKKIHNNDERIYKVHCTRAKKQSCQMEEKPIIATIFCRSTSEYRREKKTGKKNIDLKKM